MMIMRLRLFYFVVEKKTKRKQKIREYLPGLYTSLEYTELKKYYKDKGIILFKEERID